MPDRVKVHSGCKDQAAVSLRRAEPPAPKCRCKRMMDWDEANAMVNEGFAKWVVTGRTRGVEEVPCRLCARMDAQERKTCGNCAGVGVVSEPRIWDTYNNDIVLITDGDLGFKEKTPRVPTIEAEHIGYAVLETGIKAKQAQDRIMEYANLIQLELHKYGATIYLTGKDGKRQEVYLKGKKAPPNKAVGHAPGTIKFKDGSTNKSWYWELEGEDNDWGRAV
jgi:hypothetical protein